MPITKYGLLDTLVAGWSSGKTGSNSQGSLSSINGKLGIDVTGHTMGSCLEKEPTSWVKYWDVLASRENNFALGYQRVSIDAN